jgi:DNA-binding PadR family transcriptional regulator
MLFKYAILGFLSWQPMTGYDLKKMFEDSLTLYWSGNNNQIYRTLVDLHKQGLVSREIQQQENYPARKVYSITDKGRQDLRQWLLSTPELPQQKHAFLIQLTWADQLLPEELDHLLEEYENEVLMQLLLTRAPKQQELVSQARTSREACLWEMIHENSINRYESELAWVRKLRHKLAET